MRVSVIILALAFTILAAAQSTTTTAAPTEPTDPTSICLKACDKSDVDCKAKCVGVPNPNTAMVNATNDCVAKCAKDNKSTEDSKPYNDCVQACIKNEYLVSSGAATEAATPTATGTASVTAAASGSGSARATPTGSGSGSGSATGTRTGASASASSAGAASAGYTVTGPFIGLFAVAAGLIVL